MMNRYFAMCAIAASLLPGIASAHHGLDFITVETAHLPEQGTGYAIGRMDYISEDRYEMEFEPALLYGATDWMSLEIHAHIEKPQGESANYESLAPAIHFRLTPRQQRFSLGLSAEYEIADASDDEDVATVTAIVGYESSGWMADANILYEKATDTSAEWAYAAGVRRSFNHKHGFGLELNGSLESHGSSELLLAYYGELSERFSVNAGVGSGIDGGPDWSARTTFILKFK